MFLFSLYQASALKSLAYPPWRVSLEMQCVGESHRETEAILDSSPWKELKHARKFCARQRKRRDAAKREENWQHVAMACLSMDFNALIQFAREA